MCFSLRFHSYGLRVGAAGGDNEGLALQRLRLLLASVCLRRTKAILDGKLPTKTVEIVKVKLDDASRIVYDSLFKSAKSALRAAIDAAGDEGVLSAYMQVLECILRLRQAVDAIELVPASRVAAANALLSRLDAAAKDPTKPAISLAEAKALFASLTSVFSQDEDAEELECCVCMDALTPESCRILRGCKHHYCTGCVDNLLHGGGAKCPLCRSDFKRGDVMSQEELSAALAEAPPVPEAEVKVVVDEASAPPKVLALLEGLREMEREGVDRKAVVFSTFTSFLDVIERYLSHCGYR